MWPFRRKTPGEIDLDDLQSLVESSPVKRYVNILLLDLAKTGEDALCTLSKSHPLPSPAFCTWEEEIPPFEKVRNRLKVMAGVDPVVSHEPVKGRIELSIGVRPCIIHTEFDDRPEDPRVYLHLEWLQPEPGPSPPPERS